MPPIEDAAQFAVLIAHTPVLVPKLAGERLADLASTLATTGATTSF